MKEFSVSFEDIDRFSYAKLLVIIEAFLNNFDVDNPDLQIAPWLRQGVHYLRMGKTVLPSDINRFEKAGGTDHPDPFFR